MSSDQGDVAYSIMAPLGYLSGMYSSMEIDIIWYIEAEPDMKILFIIQGNYNTFNLHVHVWV